jgi:histidinol dehydrogenase
MRWLETSDPDFEQSFQLLLDDARQTTSRVDATVAGVIAEVRQRGDAALVDLTSRFDRWAPRDAAALAVTAAEMDAATAAIPSDQRSALQLAASRIEAFHAAQMPQDVEITDAAGVITGLRWGPLDAVGIYVPGGKAAYPSSVLMNALPARVAGVRRIAMCVPTPDGVLNPLVLAAARLAGVSEIWRIGGAQAVGAMAWGTASLAPVDRIVGPGNAYVAEAKRQVFGRVGIDSIAGPSEVVVLADGHNDPRHVALDLLAQAEHDEVAQSILLTDDAAFGRRVADCVDTELARLPRAAIAGASWLSHGAIVVVTDWSEAVTLTNRLAPEHLQVMVEAPRVLMQQIRHAGAAFLGRNCPEALGDYVAGPNHVLPTGRTARFASGLSVFDFLKRTTWVEADAGALATIGPAAVTLARAEGLEAHALSVAVRLESARGHS